MMKRMISLLSLVLLLLSLCACGAPAQTPADTTPSTTEATLDVTATDSDKAQLEALYAGRTVFHGELHDHSNSGRRSDGKVDLAGWKIGMAARAMDFATLVDHRQTDHMYHELWDDTLFIGGTEAMTYIGDLGIEDNKLHYNMIFSDVESLEAVLNEFPNEFAFINGLFEYRTFSKAQFQKLITSIKAHGGMFVLVHPKSEGYIKSDDPLMYWFDDWTGIEVWYSYRDENMNGVNSQANYKLWTDLLAAGKYVWATAGHDKHREPSDISLTAVYAEERHSASWLSHIRVGDFTCGGIGIRMCVGQTAMGSQGSFDGQRLVGCVSDFHRSFDRTHSYRLDILDDTGLLTSTPLDPSGENWFALDTASTAKFYRVEVYDETIGAIVAIGNPIWNE